jgi:hypothetical protein
MANVADIFLRVREDFLSDPDKKRWSDSTLLRHLEDGLIDFAIKVKFYKEEYLLNLVKGQHIYKMPENCIVIKSATFNGAPLTFISSDIMDTEFGPEWRQHTSENKVTHLVMDDLDAINVRVYPRPFIDDEDSRYTFNPDVLGVDVTIEGYTESSPYGIIEALVDSEVVDSVVPTFGVLSSVVEGGAIIVTYVRHPIIPSTVLDSLEVGRNFNKCLVSYIAAKCLMQDLDTTNRQIGKDEMRMYESMLDELKDISRTNFTSNGYHRSCYNGLG